MYPNPQDALPLAARPNIEQYKKQAKELLKKFKAGDLPAGDAFQEFAARELAARPALTTAQFVIARAHGFLSWPKLAEHIESVTRAASPISNFERAADAIASGDLKTLDGLLGADRDLVRARSTREHRATLLHYVSANGVENFRQKTPKNIVAVAERLLDAGADVNAECDVYGGRATTLNLSATSVYPHRAGVQIDLLRLLLDRGAEIREGDVRACLANGRGEAAEFLANRAPTLSVEEAAGVGRLDLVTTVSTPAFLYACQYGRDDVVESLLDRGMDIAARDGDEQTGLHHAVMGAQLATIKLLLQRGAPLDVKNVYGGTPLGQAFWCAKHNDNAPDYPAIIEILRAAAAKS